VRSDTPADIALPRIATGTSVPRIIHQVMMQGWDALPPEVAEGIAALRARNPGWEYRFYDAAAVEEFIERVYGTAMLRIYRSIDPVYHAPRSDLFRHLVCHAEGGVYFDIKSTALRPLDEVIRPDDAYILSQRPELVESIAKLGARNPGWEYRFYEEVGVEG
jgi:mannosyltransferase OCH1-like enzyme